MEDSFRWMISIILSYLLGAIPTGYWMGRVLKGIDVRRFGSGNLGATNVYRVLGKWPGTVTLILDMLKGLLAVRWISLFLAPTHGVDFFRICSGLAAVAGHNWTCFLKFKGGKGIATSAGVFLGLAPGVTLVLVLVWGLVAYLTRYVSAASLVTSAFLPISLFLFEKPREWVAAGLLLSVVSLWKHRTNIRRLMNGTESKIGQKACETGRLA